MFSLASQQLSRVSRCNRTRLNEQKRNKKSISVKSQKTKNLPATATATAATAFMISATLPAFATMNETEIAQIADGGSVVTAVVGLCAIGAAGAALMLTDPSKRREAMMETTGGDEAASVREYFDKVGFERWQKIYGETDEVNKVQLDIRKGHQQTVDKILDFLPKDMSGMTVCDAGAGTGSLAIPLCHRGAGVSASDISASMIGEAETRYKQSVASGKKAPTVAPKFEALGLEECSGKYDVVTCIDVMIHYPDDRVAAMVAHLAGLSTKKLIISFAPKTLAYSILKRIGELFPGPSKATRAYLHDEGDVEEYLKKAGFAVKRRQMTATSFYFSRILECERI
jgi:magnesium-protoporphyrin O-methyltransferase